jgi:integrase/recombinase XerD
MKHLSREELTRLLTIAKQNSERDWLMILVSYWHGLRVSEAIELTHENIRDGFITVARKKGSMKTVQPLVRASDPLYDESALVKMTGRFFPITRMTAWNRIQRYGKIAGIPSHLLHPHILKHSIGMHSIKTAGIENVRQYLGHTSIASTGAYLKVDDDVASKAIAAAAGGL